MRVGRLRDGLVLLALALYASPFFWQALTSVRPDAELHTRADRGGVAWRRMLADLTLEVGACLCSDLRANVPAPQNRCQNLPLPLR